MVFPWSWREAGIYYTRDELAAAQNALSAAGIRHRYRRAARAGAYLPPMRPPAQDILPRSAGEGATLFYLYVPKQSLPAARGALGK